MLKAIRNTMLWVTAAILGAGLSSCDLVQEDSDCVSSYNMVRFKFDHNIKFADAFDHEVEHVALLVFDSESGTLVKRIEAEEEELDEFNGLPLDIAPGTYDLLVWGGNLGKSFDVALGTVGQSNIADFHAYMHRIDEEGNAHVREELEPLFHGLIKDVKLSYAAPSKPNIVTVPLMKDTNEIRVVLQQLSGDPMDVENFDFYITDANGWLNHDNSLRDNVTITYHPWYTYSGKVDINTDAEDAPNTPKLTNAPDTRAALGAVLAEFTTSRLTTMTDPILNIVNKEDRSQVMRINIRDYALLVKGFNHSSMDDQEYLDRQGEYNMTFFLDKNLKWVSTVVIINDWRIVLNEGPIQ